MKLQKSPSYSLRIAAVLGLFVAAGQAAGAADGAGKSVELFNGKDLTGWTVIGCEAVVQDGAILIKAGNGVIQTERRYGDFVLEAEWKALKSDNWDSGIYFRYESIPKGRPWPAKYQANLRKGMEGNVDELPGAKSQGLTKPGEWNHFKLTLQGPTVSLEINGKPAWKATGVKEPEGYICLQAEVPGGGQFLFRNIRITTRDGTAAANPEKRSLWADKAPVGDGQFEAANATITVHRPAADKANGAAVVICPGGGYGGLVVGAEGHGIARWLNEHGIAGIVLEYRLPKGRAFVPLLDAQWAIRTVRFNAKSWGIDPARIGIIGFSAGGHSASTAGTHFDAGDPGAADPIDRVSCRPDFAILIYPVITMDAKTHGGSKANLLGRDPKPEMAVLFSNEKQVTDKTPPMFLAHAKDDTLVVPDNSRSMYEALKSHGVAAEFLELPSGGHGLNGYKGPMWDAWQTKSLQWLAAQKMTP